MQKGVGSGPPPLFSYGYECSAVAQPLNSEMSRVQAPRYSV